MFFLLTIDNDGDTLNLALVQYIFDGAEHSVLNCPHGNSKKQEGYIRTLPSTRQHLKKVSRSLTPKFAVKEVTTAVGGLLEATSAGSLPRNRQQASDMRRRYEVDAVGGSGRHKDPLFSIMLCVKKVKETN